MAWYSIEDMQQIMREIPPSSQNMTESIYNDVIRRAYLIYDDKKHMAACTRCGHVWDIAPGEYAHMSHHQDLCPMCGEVLTCLSAGRGRKAFGEYHRLLSFAEKDGTLWAVLNEITVVFNNFGRPSLYRTPTAVYKLSSSEQRYWSRKESWGGEPYYIEPMEIKVPHPPMAMQGWSKWEDSVYIEDLKDMILRSDARYLYEENMEYEMDFGIIRHLAIQLKYPSVEKLRKAGFKKIAELKLKDYGGSRCVNWRGNSLEKILKLPTRWVRFLREYDPSVAELAVFQHLSEEEKRLTPWAVVQDMAHSYRDEKRYREVVEQYMPFTKWLRWVGKQNVTSRWPGHILNDYEDYIRIATILGMDIRKNRIRFPEDLKAAHDDVMKCWKVEQDKELSRAIAAKARLVEDYRIGNLTVLPALSQEDLNKESAVLGHCVKTYGGKVAEGRCWIFFVRSTKDPETPYYTLETDTTGKLKQCRGDHNCNMTDEVEAFVSAFTKDLQKQIANERRLQCQTA